MSEEEKNLVERDYEGEERAKMMAEINKRLEEMETRMNTKLKGMNTRITEMNTKIEGINSELQGLRARLYDEFHKGWRYPLYRKESEEQCELNKEKFDLERGAIKIPYNEKYYRLAQIESRLKEIKEIQDNVWQTKYYF